MINFKELVFNNKSLTNQQYEEYLEYNMMKVIDLSDALEKGLVEVKKLSYFLKSTKWEFKNNIYKTLVTTFYVFAVIPNNYIQLEINFNEGSMNLGDKYCIGDYEMFLNIEMKKELIPLLECGIIAI